MQSTKPQIDHKKLASYLSEIAQLKTQVEVLSINVLHLKDEIRYKDTLARDQLKTID